MKHTEGPWKFETLRDNPTRQVLRSNTLCVAGIETHVCSDPSEQRCLDLCLIEAAPDLLETAKFAEVFMDEILKYKLFSDAPKIILEFKDKIKKSIAKAEGK